MNTEITVHPKLQHYGLTTANIDSMLQWYRKVVGATINHRSAVPDSAKGRVPFSGHSITSNDEVNHRVVFFEMPGLSADSGRSRHPRVQHVASNTRRSMISWAPMAGSRAWTFFRCLPSTKASRPRSTIGSRQNLVELNANIYHNDWTATEHVQPSGTSSCRSIPTRCSGT